MPEGGQRLWSLPGGGLVPWHGVGARVTVTASGVVPIRTVDGALRAADLTAEPQRLKEWRLPVVIVWSTHDDVIPAAATASLRAAAGDPE